jgi:hypothetical protein
MRSAIAGLALWAGLAAAAPSSAEPTGLDRLALLPGTWQTEGQTFDSPFTKAGPQHYSTRRDCWREESAYKCVYVVNGTLQLYDIYGWDAQDKVYLQTRITPQGKQPDFRLTIQDKVWTYAQDIQTKDGKVMHYRILRTYDTSTHVEYTNEFSEDGKTWTPISRGTETRTDGKNP